MLPGILLCIAVALAATACGRFAPVVGAPVFSIVLGAAVAVVARPKPPLRPGIAFASKTLLQWSIVLLGANLSIGEIAQGGARSLPVMIGTLVITLALAYFIGRALGLGRDLRRLLGIGTAICGGSAIAAVSSVIEADEADIAYALGTVFLFNVVAVLVFPALGHAMHLSQSAFGLWSGTAINDTSSVVAASIAYGHDAGTVGIVTKLTRTLFIVPIVLFYAWRRMRAREGQGKPVAWKSVMPWFVVWFVAAAAGNSMGAIPHALHAPLQTLAIFAIVVALAGVGLGTDIQKIRSAGFRPLALGAILWIAIALSSLGIAATLHLWSKGAVHAPLKVAAKLATS